MKLLVCALLLLFTVVTLAKHEQRSKRSFNIFDWLSTEGRCTGCPRRCLDDKAVIAGYCCGCARVSDFLPVNCASIPGHCPADGRRLCRNYDYMLDCCCP